MPPAVTVAIPVRNEASSIEATINAVLAQSFADFEILISDNGSTDGTMDICRRKARGDARIRLLQTRKPLPVMQHFEAVARAGRGEFFLYCGGHDRLRPDALSAMVEEHRSDPNLALVYSDPEIRKADGSVALLSSIALDRESASGWRRTYATLCGVSAWGIYGMFRRTCLLRSLPFVRAVATDLLAIALAGLQGGIRRLPRPCWIARDHIRPRTWEDAYRHWEDVLWREGQAGRFHFIVLPAPFEFWGRTANLELSCTARIAAVLGVVVWFVKKLRWPLGYDVSRFLRRCLIS